MNEHSNYLLKEMLFDSKIKLEMLEKEVKKFYKKGGSKKAIKANEIQNILAYDFFENDFDDDKKNKCFYKYYEQLSFFAFMLNYCINNYVLALSLDFDFSQTFSCISSKTYQDLLNDIKDILIRTFDYQDIQIFDEIRL